MPVKALLTGLLLLVVGKLVAVWLGTEAAIVLLAVLAAGALARHEKQVARLTQWAGQPLGTPLPEASGNWSAAFQALHRRARQAAAQRSELHAMGERFRLAAEALPEGVLILDKYQLIEWMNPQAESLLGLDSRNDLGVAMTYLLRDPEFIAFISQPLETSKPLLLKPMRNPAHTLRIRATPFSAGHTLLLIEDLTALDRLENVRRDFVANVSHELRTPLTVVNGFLETLREQFGEIDHPPSVEEVIEYLALATEHTYRMQQLIEDLLTLSTLESGAAGMDEENVTVAHLMELIHKETVALSAGRHRISLTVSGPEMICGNSRELRSAFGNLASNAVRYTPPGGEIDIAWSDDAEQVGGGRFSIRDTGIGIGRQHLPRLTERFYRVDRGRSRESGGTGLGLAIVKHVLERHQATLQIHSTVGQGSEFIVRIPPSRIVADALAAHYSE